jgi:hypothetical protein
MKVPLRPDNSARSREDEPDSFGLRATSCSRRILRASSEGRTRRRPAAVFVGTTWPSRVRGPTRSAPAGGSSPPGSTQGWIDESLLMQRLRCCLVHNAGRLETTWPHSLSPGLGRLEESVIAAGGWSATSCEWWMSHRAARLGRSETVGRGRGAPTVPPSTGVRGAVGRVRVVSAEVALDDVVIGGEQRHEQPQTRTTFSGRDTCEGGTVAIKKPMADTAVEAGARMGVKQDHDARCPDLELAMVASLRQLHRVHHAAMYRMAMRGRRGRATGLP